MANKIHKKAFTDESVIDAARRRFNSLYDRFDKVVVSFSGGKDSTVCLNLALEVATARDRLPLDVYFWDEEAIQPETVDYVERVRQRPDVALKWLCVPIKHRNACSRQQPYWYPWAPEDRDKWVRPMPAGAITELAGFKRGDSVPELAHLVYGPEHGTVADVRGLRADESLRRYRAVAMRLEDNWIGGPRGGYSFPVSPIYDFTTIDVWTAPRLFGWDYNRSYDLMALAGIPPHQQRVCPPFGEEPLSHLYIYAECWPDLWAAMTKRVHGAATAGRYARSELYGFGNPVLPPGMTWRDYTFALLDLYPKDLRAVVASSLRALLATHKSKTQRPVHETDADPLTGLSWKFLANIASRGDLKLRRVKQVTHKATTRRAKDGTTMESALDPDSDGTRY